MKKITTIIALIGSSVVNANITVTPVNTTIHTYLYQTYQLDLDNDGTADYSIYAYKVGGNNRIDVSMLSANSEMVSLMAGTVRVVSAMNFGDNFGSAWQSTQTFIYHNVEFVALSNTSNKYIAFRLFKGGNYYYGWLKIGVGPFGDFLTLIEYGYEDIPNTLITAGQTISTVGIHQNENNEQFTFYPNPVNNKVTISGLTDNKITSIKIYSITGILEKDFSTLTRELDLEAIKSGIYFIEIIADNRRTIHKIIKN